MKNSDDDSQFSALDFIDDESFSSSPVMIDTPRNYQNTTEFTFEMVEKEENNNGDTAVRLMEMEVAGISIIDSIGDNNSSSSFVNINIHKKIEDTNGSKVDSDDSSMNSPLLNLLPDDVVDYFTSASETLDPPTSVDKIIELTGVDRDVASAMLLKSKDDIHAATSQIVAEQDKVMAVTDVNLETALHALSASNYDAEQAISEILSNKSIDHIVEATGVSREEASDVFYSTGNQAETAIMVILRNIGIIDPIYNNIQ